MTAWYSKDKKLFFTPDGFDRLEKKNISIQPPEPIRLSERDLDEMMANPTEYAAFALWASYWLEKEVEEDQERGDDESAETAKALLKKLKRFLYKTIEIK